MYSKKDLKENPFALYRSEGQLDIVFDLAKIESVNIRGEIFDPSSEKLSNFDTCVYTTEEVLEGLLVVTVYARAFDGKGVEVETRLVLQNLESSVFRGFVQLLVKGKISEYFFN